MTQRWLVSFAAAASIFGAGADLRADDIGPPPSDCPRGSAGQSSHAGEWCSVQACQSDADCKKMFVDHGTAEGTCESTSLCIAKKKIYAHHRVVSDGGDDAREISVAVGACGVASSCKPESRCEKAMRCVAPSKSLVKEASRGCGCGKSTGPKSSVLVGLVVGAWLLRRARRR